MILKYIYSDEESYSKKDYKTLRDILQREFKLSRREIIKLKKSKAYTINDEFTFLDKELKDGDIIKVIVDFEESNDNIVPVEGNLDILFEDEYLLIVNKPSNMPVHPTAYHFDDTLSNIVRYYFDKNNINRKIRLVNRLDRDTTGIVIIAKDEISQDRLRKQMRAKEFKKTYLAIVDGILEKKEDTINAPIGRKLPSIIEREVSNNGQEAITKYKVIKEDKNLNISLLEIKLETGRTHQIRVHMQYIGHPILGDTLYGKESTLINRQALHAYQIRCIHPITNKELIVNAPIAEDMKII